ncbi:MAG: D-alanyl-D-alanine carboxypeptidase family protein [Planktomarina sp.]
MLAAVLLLVTPAHTAPYAAMVIDARTGKVLHSRSADQKLHPASLTKMMTLYIAFQAVENGEISLDQKVKISRNAASEPPSKLGLRAGQKIALRYLIRAAAIKSANDAATAIAEAISGSEKAFTQRMTRTARAMGMKNTVFLNAHGLTQVGHYSTARDMTTLGRHVLYDYPDYYNLFSRRTADAGIRTVRNTNTRLLDNYRGADGIKTGYTRAAGYNLVASAQRGKERVIATVFGGKSTASRNARVAELLNMGFSRAPTHVRVRKPRLPAYTPTTRTARATPAPLGTPGVRRTNTGAIKRSLRPQMRPFVPEVVLVAANSAVIDTVVETAINTPEPEAAPEPVITAQVKTIAPKARPSNLVPAAATVAEAAPIAEPEAQNEELATIKQAMQTSNPDWAINVGKYDSHYQAERILLRTALAEMTTLDGAKRHVKPNSNGYEALFVGLTRDNADLACRRLQAQQISCMMVAPG